MSTNTQKNVNNSKQTVIVNVNTNDFPKKKRPQKKRPKEDIPLEQEAPVIRPSVSPPAFPRRPQPYLPNSVQISNNTYMPPPPYFDVPQTNKEVATRDRREQYQNKLQDLYDDLVRNATTQTDIIKAQNFINQAVQTFNEENVMPQAQAQPQPQPEVQLPPQEQAEIQPEIRPPPPEIPDIEMEDSFNNQLIPQPNYYVPNDVIDRVRNNVRNNVSPEPRINQIPPIIEEPYSPLRGNSGVLNLPPPDNLQRLLELPEPELEDAPNNEIQPEPEPEPEPPQEVVRDNPLFENEPNRNYIETYREAFREGQRLFALASLPENSRQRQDARAQLKDLARQYGLNVSRYSGNLWNELKQVINSKMNDFDKNPNEDIRIARRLIDPLLNVR